MLKSQDVVVLAKLFSYQNRKKNWTQASLAEELCLSPSQVNYAIKRLLKPMLLSRIRVESEWKPVPFIQLCEEFLIHGFKFVFPPKFGSHTVGLPTAYAAVSLNLLKVSYS